MPTSRNVYLIKRPQGKLTEDAFDVRAEPLPEPGADEARVRTLYIPIDASNRMWMHGDNAYHAGAQEGAVMTSRALGRVEACPSGALAEGALVAGDWGWRERANVAVSALRPSPSPPEDMPISHLLSVFSISGLTGWFGALEVGGVRPGDVVVVSAAAGAAGSFAAQIAKAAGARVIGVAGGEAKCAWLRELGIEPIDRKKQNLAEALDALLPAEGADMYFDNVGGETLETMLARVRIGGRVVCCGAIGLYDSDDVMTGTRGVPALVVTRRITMRGFIVLDFADRFDEARRRLAAMVRAGTLRVREDIMEGIDAMPRALMDLLAGGNIGKRLVRIDPEAR